MQFGEPFGGLFPGVRGAVLAALLRTGAPLTGRQIHSLVRDEFSLWSVQQALAGLVKLGIAEVSVVGRAHLHAVNEQHYAIPHLRALLSPIEALRAVVREAVGDAVVAVILFGSVARGESTSQSDVDLAVVADFTWPGRIALEDAVRTRVGNDCDVLVFDPDEFSRLAHADEEPVIKDILAEGVVLHGVVPNLSTAVA